MTFNEKHFDLFLIDSFRDGVYRRELRLSKEEVVYLKEKYPNATLESKTKPISDEKIWYKVDLIGSMENYTERLIIKEKAEPSSAVIK